GQGRTCSRDAVPAQGLDAALPQRHLAWPAPLSRPEPRLWRLSGRSLVPRVRGRRDQSGQGGEAGAGAAGMTMTAPRRPITHRGPAWSKSPHWSEIRHREWAPEVEKSALVGNSTSKEASRDRKVRTGRKFGYGRRGWLAAVVMVLLSMVLAGCGGSPAVPKSSTPMAPPSEAAPSPESTADLAAMKKAADIADCPASDPKVAAISSGLPDVVLPCLGGGRAVRLAGLRGKPMMINIWAQWCGPC